MIYVYDAICAHNVIHHTHCLAFSYPPPSPTKPFLLSTRLHLLSCSLGFIDCDPFSLIRFASTTMRWRVVARVWANYQSQHSWRKCLPLIQRSIATYIYYFMVEWGLTITTPIRDKMLPSTSEWKLYGDSHSYYMLMFSKAVSCLEDVFLKHSSPLCSYLLSKSSSVMFPEP